MSADAICRFERAYAEEFWANRELSENDASTRKLTLQVIGQV